MRKTVATLFLFFTSLLVLHAEVLIGKVVHISDGDTITVLNQSKEQFKVRLYGIDAPESKQAFGNVAKKHLSSIVSGKEVKVEWKSKDRYGRLLGKVFVGDLDVNLKMLKDGLAWHFKRYDNTRSFSEAEKEAKEKKLGLWREPNPTPPWNFRIKKK